MAYFFTGVWPNFGADLILHSARSIVAKKSDAAKVRPAAMIATAQKTKQKQQQV